MDTVDTQTQDQDALPIEQREIGMLDNEDRRPEPAQEQPAAEQPAAEQPKEEPVDPRAARMERLSERAHERSVGELEAANEAMTAPANRALNGDAQPEPEPQPERMLKIKVRGEIVELPESEVIARAQKVDAADSYLNEARDVLRNAEEIRRADPKPAPQQEQRQEPERVDRLATAIEQIQIGGDPAEIRRLLDEEMSDRAAAMVRSTMTEDQIRSRASAFDTDLDQGLSSVGQAYEGLAQDPITRNVVTSIAGGMQGELIAQFLEKADDNTKSAFAQAGITAEGVRTYDPRDAHALYRDMSLKGFPLLRPSAIIQAAGKTVAERFGATTRQPNPAPTTTSPAPINRTERKEGLQQPARASLSRTPPGNAPPKSEPERAQSARQEIRSARRTGMPR